MRTSGAERMAWRTSAQLARRGACVTVLTDAEPPPDLGDTRWTVHTSPETLARAHPGPIPDVVHVYDLAMPEYAAIGRDLARRFGAFLAVTPASAPETWPDRAMGTRLCVEADAVFTLTGTEASAIRSLCPGPVGTLSLPQAPDLVGRPDPERFRAAHGLTGRIVLFLGRKLAAKGYDTLLAAAPIVWSQVPDAVFVFCGPECEAGAADAIRAVGDDRIRDVGLLDDRAKHDALAASDVLALPSSVDVFPLVFVEAWWCGKPVVSGRFHGVDEVVREGIDGLVVHPRRPREVADALIRLLTDEELRTALGEKGRIRARRDMGWDRIAAVIEAAYRREGSRRQGESDRDA
jgi:glycosyltransferase involved in cell wall biosynthesis